jgi:hypothetical protein
MRGKASMTRKPKPRAESRIDVLERVLDKGIVIDAMASVSVLGIAHVVDIDARIVVASIDTYVQYAELLSGVGSVARPQRMRVGRTQTRLAATASRTGDRISSRFNSADSIRARGLSVRLNCQGCGEPRRN